MKKSFLLVIFMGASLFLIISFLIHTTKVKATATHIVISEIQVASQAHSSDEFVELYNPTESTIDLTGWHITKEASGHTGESGSNIVSSLSGSIHAHGFFLLANENGYASSAADLTYSININENSTILLYSDDKKTLVDKVGFGFNVDPETSPAATPSVGKSIERKANADSTPDSMSSGSDQFAGNGEDTDNNATDFILRDIPQPQNSQSAIEPVPTPTPTNTPTPMDTPTPTVTPIPTDTPTPMPTETPTPTMEPTAIPTPTIAPTNIPTPTPGDSDHQPLHVSCTTKYRAFHIFSITIQIPIMSCRLVGSPFNL